MTRVADETSPATVFQRHLGPTRPSLLPRAITGWSRVIARGLQSLPGIYAARPRERRHKAGRRAMRLSSQRLTSVYGYSMSPVFNAGGQRMTSVFGSRNCSMSLDFTPWNCTAITRGSAHSPFEPT